jgi:hypothetical protein
MVFGRHGVRRQYVEGRVGLAGEGLHGVFRTASGLQSGMFGKTAVVGDQKQGVLFPGEESIPMCSESGRGRQPRADVGPKGQVPCPRADAPSSPEKKGVSQNPSPVAEGLGPWAGLIWPEEGEQAHAPPFPGIPCNGGTVGCDDFGEICDAKIDPDPIKRRLGCRLVGGHPCDDIHDTDVGLSKGGGLGGL